MRQLRQRSTGWRSIICTAAATVALASAAAPMATANPLSPIWTGAYVGVHGGANWADVDTRNFGSFDSSQATFGGHIGYNFAFAGLVLGVEADASPMGSKLGFSTVSGGTASMDTDWAGSLRARAGITLGPALLYATAGWAWSKFSLIERSGSGTEFKSSGTYDGVVYGIGAEAYVVPAVSLRIEALRYDYGQQDVSVGGGVAALKSIDRDDTVVRAGVTLHFR
ncbi:MAG: outer membrane beta-barrel protein [Hyphomicrobiaceae bacterium]